VNILQIPADVFYDSDMDHITLLLIINSKLNEFISVYFKSRRILFCRTVVRKK
jgi:hypothetical protein